ncbi:MAG: hypothetical protein ABJK10_03930, partial [Rhodopirellula bahusiensis]
MKIFSTFGCKLSALLTSAVMATAVSAAPPTTESQAVSSGASIRIVAHTTDEGGQSIAASIQPGAEDAMLRAVRQSAGDVVIVVDTSASQVGAYRDDAMKALQATLESVGDRDVRVALFAADVQANELTSGFAAPGDSNLASATTKLTSRLPLGNTNLVSVLDTVRASLTGRPDSRTRSIVYIGDAASIDAAQNLSRFENLIDALRNDHISVHSVAIGPTKNVELMGVLANQTGGVLGVVGTDATPAEIADSVADAATMSPIWISEIKSDAKIDWVHGKRLPPLRLDRDSIYLGQLKSPAQEVSIDLVGGTLNSDIQIKANSAVESDNLDFAFLTGLIEEHKTARGLLLATAGSPMLRQTAQAMTARAESLANAATMAMQQGNMRGARAVAQEALQADPNNAEAKAILKMATPEGKRLILQNGDDNPFDDIFGGGGDAADDS